MKLNIKIAFTLLAGMLASLSYSKQAWIENLRNNYSEMLIAQTTLEEGNGTWIEDFPVTCIERKAGFKLH